MTIEEAQAQLTDDVMRLPGVTGIGIGDCDGTPCIKVYVVRRTPELDRAIPPRHGGHPVSVEESGEIRALEAPERIP